MKIKIDPIILVFIGIFIGVFLAYINPATASANSDGFTLDQNGNLTIYTSPIDLNYIGGTFNTFYIYKGDVFPNETNPTGSQINTAYNFPFSTLCTSDLSGCTSNDTTFIQLNLDQVIGNADDGNYWLQVKTTQNLTSFEKNYYNFTKNNGLWIAQNINPVNPSNNNRINTITAPLPYGTTTATTTFDIKISFYSVAGFDYLTLPPQSFGWELYDAVSGELEKQYTQNVSEGTAFTLSYSTTTIAIEGSKILKSFIRNTDTGLDIVPIDETFFNVATNTYLIATGLNSPAENPSGLTQINCDTFDIGCQFQKAIVYLFVPPQNVLDRFTNVWSRLSSVKPFGYLTAGLDALRGINNTSGIAYTMPTIPFVDDIFNPLNNGISVLLWGVFAFVFYKRIKQIDI